MKLNKRRGHNVIVMEGTQRKCVESWLMQKKRKEKRKYKSKLGIDIGEH